MSFRTLISPAELAPHLVAPDWVVVDCRFSLADADLGRQNYATSHIPGAGYAHLNDDLSGPIRIGFTGRHPLPTPAAAAAIFGRLGIGPETQVIAYDDAGGALPASRLWWMLRWLGHDNVAVLDGGWQRWRAEGYPVTAEIRPQPALPFTPRPRVAWVVNAEEIESIRKNSGWKLLDARSAERFRGENETLHPVAGHIPGAISAPYTENLTPEGRMKSPEALRARFSALLGETPIERTVLSCGSGVTACHNLLALAIARFGDGKLYPGSWSEWITDPKRPVAV
jgi:thiosulfate/3-mercaptopyruvate sulfurtransferase